MKLISVNVGLPRTISWKGRQFETGIFKIPVDGVRVVRSLNVDGDRQADLSVHGGPKKAVYAYPIEHYPLWKSFLGIDLSYGAMGENLTLEGLLEADICIGDTLSIGSAEFVVTQPRIPCFKLEAKFGRDDLVKEFLQSGFSGFYLEVVKEGQLEAGNPVQILSREPQQISVADFNKMQRREPVDPEMFRRALDIEAITEGWRDALTRWLSEWTKESSSQ